MVDWLRRHEDFELPSGQPLASAFADFQTEFPSLKEYCDHMEKPKVWGDVWTLMAAAECFKVCLTLDSN